MVAIKASWPLRPPSTRHSGCVPVSAAILRPMAAMAVSQPSARPHDGCHTAVAAIWPEDGCREFDPAFSPPPTRAQVAPLSLREPPHPCSGWLASLSLSHRVGTLGQDIVSSAILRPMAATAVCQPSCGRADGRDTAIAAIGRRMAALTGTQPKWRVCWEGGVARML